MANSPAHATTATELPLGTWQVDPSSSELAFMARGMFGLVPAKGTFGSFEGQLEVTPDGPNGELRVQSTTLDTGNAKRDTHLRSADFFDVATFPTFGFVLSGTTVAADGTVSFTGTLKIRDSALQITAPLEIGTHDDHLHLHTTLAVDRAAAGLGWSKLGMIKGKAQLDATLTLIRQP